MGYRFVILPAAEKSFENLEPVIARRILTKLKWIAAQNDPLRHAIRLHHPSIGDIRFRIGDYRAVALVDERKGIIAIVEIGHRREIYR